MTQTDPEKGNAAPPEPEHTAMAEAVPEPTATAGTTTTGTSTAPVVTDPTKPAAQAGAAGAVISTNPEEDFGPRNRWKVDLCSCFDVCFTPLCLMSCCCNILVVGQIMQRMGLDWCGNFDKQAAKNTFNTVLIIYLVYVALCFIGIGEFIAIFVGVWAIIITTRARYRVRQDFAIPSETCHCCDGQFEDCCCMYWCGCCAAIQMERHTHDESRYPYSFSSPTGLPPYAPVFYESPKPAVAGTDVTKTEAPAEAPAAEMVEAPAAEKVEERV